MESVDPEVMLDPSGLQEPQERQEHQETEVSLVQMVYQAQRGPRVREGCKDLLAPKVYLEIQDAMESQV